MASAITAPQRQRGFSDLFSFRRDPLTFLTMLSQKYGDVVRYQMGPRWVVFINHPDYVAIGRVEPEGHCRKALYTAQELAPQFRVEPTDRQEPILYWEVLLCRKGFGPPARNGRRE